jgi:ferredoxin
MVEKKAVVDSDRCAACLNCMDACPEEAIRMVSRSQPVVWSVDPAEVDQAELSELCRKAHLDPEEVVCSCTWTKAGEVAAAILKGARTPEDVSVMTGIRTSCRMWCIIYIERLLRASGLKLVPPKGYRWYDVDVSIWSVPDDVAREYPEYHIEEDRQLFQAHVVNVVPDKQ